MSLKSFAKYLSNIYEIYAIFYILHSGFLGNFVLHFMDKIQDTLDINVQ